MRNGNFNEKSINNNKNKSGNENENGSKSENRNKNKNIFVILFKLIIYITIIILILIYFSYQNFIKNSIIGEDITINIIEKENINDLGNKLNLNNLFLKLYIKNNNPDFKLLVGDFKIKKDSNITQLFETLKNPIIYDEKNITILEGWNIYDIDNYLSNLKFIEKNSYINYVNNTEKIEKLSEFFPFIKGLKTLEGFLYPDTYNINIKETQINQIVITQLENFETKIYNKYFLDENGNQKYSNSEIENIINLASILEKEEKNSKNKTIVAGILKKRLDEGWMLGADSTVCYAHKLTGEECKMVISKYIREISEYNTRTMIGLPKTPIGNPSEDTINATINYKKTPYYFYLHNISTGEIYYAITNDEHESNKKFLK